MIGIPLGFLAANATEWIFHKYVLHKIGADKRSFWAFHWHEHHRNSRQDDMIDKDYKRPFFSGWNPQTKEAAALIGGAALFLPLAPVAPFFVATLSYCGINYYVKHKRSHLDEEWAKEHLPWHWDHHMGPNQHANWCVTHPFMDHVMGTREPYLGTEAEIASRGRRAAYRAKRKARAQKPLDAAA